MTPLTIWGTALLFYALFYCWYIGFRSKVTATEVAEIEKLLTENGEANEQQKNNMLNFLAEDDGKDFVMVNLLLLNEPRRESSQKLNTYQKIFLGTLLRKAGHPVFVAQAASGNIENVASDHDEGWGMAGMVRYRSRRDLMEMLPATVGSEHHGLKLAALERTFAFPASPWFVFGGPKILVPMALALIAALINLSM